MLWCIVGLIMVRTRGGRRSWRDLSEQIRKGITEGRYAEGSKLPSEADLMREFGASKTTVHRALRELAAEMLVRRVERLGTFVNDSSVRKTRRVGVVFRTSDNFLEFKMLQGVREAFNPADQLALYDTGNDLIAEYDAVNRAADETDGILIIPNCSSRTSQRLEELSDRGIPIVCMDRYPVNARLASVTSDNYLVTRNALVQLASEGHKRVAFFGLYNDRQSALHDRFLAYQDCCRDVFHISPREYVRLIPARIGDDSWLTMSLMEDAILRLVSGDNPVTLALCANEYYLEAIVELGRRLPDRLAERLEIISFNDAPQLRYPGFKVHVIRQDAVGIGRTAAKEINRLFNEPGRGISRVEVPATFLHAANETDLRGSDSYFVSAPENHEEYS